MNSFPPACRVFLATFLSSLAVATATGGCRNSAGTADPLPSTRVCSADASRKDSIARPDSGVDVGGTAGRDSGAADADVDANGDLHYVDASSNLLYTDGPDSHRIVDAPLRLDTGDAGDDTRDGGDTGGEDSGGGDGAAGSGAGGSAGTGGSGVVDAGPDARDAFLADVARDVQDAASLDQSQNDAADGHPVQTDVVPDVNASSDASPTFDVVPIDAAHDSPVAQDTPSADKATCHCEAGYSCDNTDGSCQVAICMAPQYAVDWNVIPGGLATDVDGNVFTAGTMYGLTSAPIAFGSVSIGAGAGANAYAARLNSDTGATVWAKAWGDDEDQQVLGAAASQTNVAIIGNYIGSMGITGLSANTGLLPVDFIVGLDAASGTPAWAKKIDLGGVGMASIYSNPRLNAYYVCGASAVAATDLNASLTLGSADGNTDMVVAKINATDGTVAWARQIGGAGAQACSGIAADVATDGTVNAVYLTGTYNGTLDFGNGVAALTNISNPSRQILWVAKLADSDGHSMAAKAWGTLGSQTVSSITTDPSGNVLIAGALVQNIPFGGAVGTITASGTDAFVAKFDASLTPLWAHNWGDASTQAMRSVATDSAGDVFAVGLFSGSVTAGGTTLTAAGADILTMKLDSSGNVHCISQYGGAGGDEGDILVVNRFANGSKKDRAVFTGALAGDVSFGNGISLSTPTAGTQYGYVVGINPNSL